MQYTWRSEEGARHPGAGITRGCELPSAGSLLLMAESSLQSQNLVLFATNSALLLGFGVCVLWFIGPRTFSSTTHLSLLLFLLLHITSDIIVYFSSLNMHLNQDLLPISPAPHQY